LCSPYSRPIAGSLDSTAECRTPFRGPLRFIVIAVMSVMRGTFLDTYGVSARRSIPDVSGGRHAIVMVSVTEETPYLSGFLTGVTAMTLMTVISGLILDRGVHLYFVGSPTASTKSDEPDAKSKESLTYAIFEATCGVGFVQPPR
jgi:hypothetical protein